MMIDIVLQFQIKRYEIFFIKKVREWFRDASKNDGKALEEFCNAFIQKNSQKIEQLFGDYLWNTISIRDTAVAKEKKENFYHGILLGLLGYKSNWIIKSNAESGTGYSDILIEAPDNRTGIVIELKYAENGNMDKACLDAIKQIEEKDYVGRLKQDGTRNFISYGIACYKKRLQGYAEIETIKKGIQSVEYPLIMLCGYISFR